MRAPVRINPDVVPTDGNPHSWLPLIGHASGEVAASGVKVMWGVLRPTFAGYAPSLPQFVQSKLRVATPADAPLWTVTAHRHEVLLPVHAGDHLRDPQTLIEMAERDRMPDAKAQATYITLTWVPTTLHSQFELARGVGRWLVDIYDVAVLLIQHVPALNGGSAPPHVHMVIPGPRAITPYSSFGRPVADLARDAGWQRVLDCLSVMAEATA